jgi:hypothetical protein
MEMRKVFANFASVVSRRSFSPRSMAPVKDRASLPRNASSSCAHFAHCANLYAVEKMGHFGIRNKVHSRVACHTCGCKVLSPVEVYS